MPTRVMKDSTKVPCVITVTTPKPSLPNARERTICAANVASAAMTIPMMF